MKFFIASPWRNKEAVKELESTLVLRGHSAWSFLDNGANLCTRVLASPSFIHFGKRANPEKLWPKPCLPAARAYPLSIQRTYLLAIPLLA